MRTTLHAYALLLFAVVPLVSCESNPIANQSAIPHESSGANLGADIALFVGGDCQPIDENGSSVNTFTTIVGDKISLTNISSHGVRILFPAELFGSDVVALRPGSSVTLSVRDEARGKTYPYSIEGCKNLGTVNTTPEIKVGDPPPIP